MDFFINTANAQAAGAGGGQSMLSALLLPVLLLVVFYFLLIRPQNKRAKEQREMLSKVAVGDEIATTGGILGKVTEGGEQFLTLEIANGVNVKLQKFQVSLVLPKGTVKTAGFRIRAGRSCWSRSCCSRPSCWRCRTCSARKARCSW